MVMSRYLAEMNDPKKETPMSVNAAMIGLAKKLGMKYVGSLRESVFKHGNYLDVEIFDLLRSDWPSQM